MKDKLRDSFRALLRHVSLGLDNPGLTWRARAYIATVCAIGLLILLQRPLVPSHDIMGLAAFVLLGGLAQMIVIRFYRNATISMGMATALAAILVFGPIYAAWVNVSGGVVHYLTLIRPKQRPIYRSAVTTATWVIAAFVSGRLYLAFGGQVGPDSDYLSSLAPIALMGLIYYIVNTLLITGAMAVEQRRSFGVLLRTNSEWLILNVASLTPLAAGVALTYQKTGLGGLAIYLAPIVMARYSFHLYAGSMENVQKANADLKEANERVVKANLELHAASEQIREANEELRVANERLNVMYEVSRSLVGSLHLEETLDRVLAATQTMGFSAGFVAGPLRDAAWCASHADMAQWTLALADGGDEIPLSRVAEDVGKQTWFRKRELYVARHQVRPLADGAQAAEQMVTLIPLTIAGEGWGVVGVATPGTPSAIEMKEILIFRSLAENALEMALAHERAEREAQIDARTGLYNHRYFQEALQRELRDAAQRNSYLSFLMIDINKFKTLNDDYGHLVGDQVLQTIGQLLRENVRSTDIACRYGGDELCVLMPHTDRSRAMEVAARIDQVIRTYPFRVWKEASSRAEGTELTLRVSIGVATFPESAETRAGLVEQADRACYRAKALGGGVAAEGARPPNSKASHLQVIK
ncbi:MAG: diguanylate cyclase [Chloroflexi bacterium]|nr:diguanylate cyclase [Chloroflexota bacterium]